MLRALIDFTLSNARRFYSSMGNLLDGKGLREVLWSCKNHDNSVESENPIGVEIQNAFEISLEASSLEG